MYARKSVSPRERGRAAWTLSTPVIRPPADLPEASGDQLPDQRLRKGLVDREVQRPGRALISGQVISERSKGRSAVRQVGEVILEGGETGDHLSLQPERGHAVRDAFPGVRALGVDGLPTLMQRRQFRLFEHVHEDTAPSCAH